MREERRIGQPVVHFEVISKDAEKLRSYYSDLFGWEFDADNGARGEPRPGAVGIGGGAGAGPDGYPGHTTFYVTVPDVEAALAKAESVGGTRMMRP